MVDKMYVDTIKGNYSDATRNQESSLTRLSADKWRPNRDLKLKWLGDWRVWSTLRETWSNLYRGEFRSMPQPENSSISSTTLTAFLWRKVKRLRYNMTSEQQNVLVTFPIILNKWGPLPFCSKCLYGLPRVSPRSSINLRSWSMGPDRGEAMGHCC